MRMRNCNNLSQPPEYGYIDLLNYGGFFVRFWGDYMIGAQKFNFNSNGFAIGAERRILIPKNATDVNVTVDMAVFFDSWVKIYSNYYPKSDEICLVAYGLIFAPVCSEVPCTSPGVLQNILKQQEYILNSMGVCKCNPYCINSRNNF